MLVNKGTSKKSSVDTTHARIHKPAARRINRLAKRLTADRRGRWAQPDVIDEALDALERELSAQASETPTP
jgi:hypothetical protein